jgi:hypothetical protein
MNQPAIQLTEREITIRRALKEDFETYANRCLKIRTKSGKIKPFALNRAQRYIHAKLEQQLAEKGKIRANILKGRQQGCSTYVEARFYWKTTHRKGIRAFILTHEDEATKNLFEMAQRFHDHNNPLLKPSTGATNAKELYFDKLDSGYRVGTARTKGTGRSGTFQYFHGSEVAFWPHADEHAKGILQAIPDEEGTESIRESTANGVGNYFHQQWKAAERGEGDYINIFIPWFWQDEYRKPADDLVRTKEEQELVDYYGLDDEQLAWRRQKIIDLSVNGADGGTAFKQEYPCNAAEAFQMTGKLGLIGPEIVMKARKAIVNGNGPLVVGVDPSRGGDRFSTIKRQGRKAYDLKSHGNGKQTIKLGEAVAICKDILDTVDPVANKKPDMMFIDAGGGADLVDRLHELGYEKRVKAIYFGATPLDMKRYTNKRNEMWGEMTAWLSDENLEVDIPDEDSLQADLIASLYRRDSHDRKVLFSKDKIKDELGYSPDEGDALGLTFAEPVIIKEKKERIPTPRYTGSGAWMG